MNFEKTAIPGLMIVGTEINADIRGTFSRVYSRQEFAETGLNQTFEQCSVSHNRKRGTMRGLHYQIEPYVEAKLVCCVHGSVFDAVVDLRRGSPTFGRAWWLRLAANEAKMIYVPEGCAHGFQTLQDDATLLYMISAPYQAAAARGLRWNDPALGIPWPEPESVLLSERDQSLPLLADIEASF